ncbi:MAG: efflux RND transporter periplasmic adaptor subunit [Planctomycetes bacterium]|nr:efflux RND transporter periplasmic adaptor subunit [Planctomycetota bacterium]
MTDAANDTSSQQRTSRLPPLRSDIEVARREADGRTEYVLKDPLSNRHFRLGAEEWFVATLLDGQRSLADVHTRAAQQYPEAALTTDEIARFVRRLALAGMLRLSGHGDLDRLLALRPPGSALKILDLFSRIFYIRIPLVNPDRFIARLHRAVGFFGRPRFLAAMAAVVLVALLLALWQWPRLAEPRAEFLSPRGLAWLLVAIVAIKIIHEFAHACVCKHYGGHVPEMGIVFIVFTPCLYCDVSDAWMFPSRRSRLAVTAAGIAVELVMAAMAACVFFVTRDGWLHQAAFSLMIVASASTLLFNGNPLLRYDGYYLLSDAVEIPNLRVRARRYLVGLARRLLFAEPVPDFDRPDRHRTLVFLYGIGGYLYGWFILYAILGLLYRKLQPYNLQALAGLLIVMSLAMQLGVPLWRLAAALGRLVRQPGSPWRFARAVALTCVLIFVVVTALNVEFTETLSRSCVVEPDQPCDVRAEQPGFVAKVLVRPGHPVAKGAPLVRLTNERLQVELRGTESDLAVHRILVDRAQAAGDLVTVGQLRTQLDQLQQLADHARRRVEQLTVTAPVAGIVVSDDLERLDGAWVGQGTLLLTVARPEQFKVTLQLNQKQAERVAVGAPAELRVRAYPRRTVEGRVRDSSLVASTTTSAVLTTLYEGDVAVRPGPAGWSAAEKIYRAELQLADTQTALRGGMSGKARIYLGRTSLGGYLWRTVRDQLSLDLLLKWVSS